MTDRDYFAAHAPIDFDFALRIWGDPESNLLLDSNRETFLAMWAFLRYEYADAMILNLKNNVHIS